MMRYAFIRWDRWGCLPLTLLVTLLLLLGCTRALEEKLEGKERELAETRKQLTEAQASQGQFEQRASALTTELHERQQSLQQLQAERDTLLASRIKADETVAGLTSRIAELTAQGTQLNTHLSETMAARSRETQQLSELSQEVERLKEELSARASLIPQLETRLTALQQERDKLREEVGGLAEQYASTRARGESVSSKLAQVREDLEGARQELAAARKAHEEAEQRAHQLRGQVDALQQELARAGTEREQARVQLADISAQRATLQTQLMAMTRMKAEADDRIDRLSNELAAVQNELVQTVNTRDAAHKQVRALTAKLEAAQKELETISLARADLEARASNLRRQLSTSTDKVLDLTEEVRRLRDQVRDEALSQLTALPKTLTKGINFSHRRTALTTDAKELLDRAVIILQNYPEVQLVIEGYTDSLGDGGFNRRLSAHRADAVREYLMNRGVAPERLVAIGRGDENPIAPNSTLYGRFLNRRIEFHLNQMARTGESGSPQPASGESSSPVQLEFRQLPKGR
ncbi:MAG: OmpA family protein [Nitrospinae bacterium]|nr:OmpA family protein [Nitrospinota bacterium]